MSGNYNNARKAPRDFGNKQGGGFNKQGGGFNKGFAKSAPVAEEVVEKPLSRREQKLHAELAGSMANEASAMAASSKQDVAPKKNFNNANNNKFAGGNNRPAAPAGHGGKKAPMHPMVAAFGNSSHHAPTDYGKNAMDFCGKGHPFDRLQFGYSPSENDEARAYHSQFTPQQWVKQRSENYKKYIMKGQRIPKPNCEPLVTMFKLKRYWASISAGGASVGGNIFDGAFAEDLLEQLASRQLRVEEGALAQ
eukprot:GILI01024032.1.p1 GENE.GILI01024032.1~~GILI01024032.1.p1  ORF type:complete len:250 (+),score=78.89 GILI01024032.1:47-796(+)